MQANPPLFRAKPLVPNQMRYQAAPLPDGRFLGFRRGRGQAERHCRAQCGMSRTQSETRCVPALFRVPAVMGGRA